MKAKAINPIPTSEIKVVKWHEVREKLIRANPVLAKIIDRLSPENLTFTYGKYSYGADIASGAEGHKFPSFLVLEKSCEVYFEYHDRPMTYKLIKEGQINLGDSNLNNEGLNWQHSLWRLSAGSQNVFMPAKISDYDKHKKLQDHFHFEVNRPLRLEDQRHIFKLLANSASEDERWKCELLFFNEEWFSHFHDPSWQFFYNYLLLEDSKHNLLTKHSYLCGLLMSILQEEKSIKFSASQIEQIAQLLLIAQNAIPGYIPLTNEMIMPVKTIQESYINIYKLENYAPIILGPGFLDDNPLFENAYFSLGYRCYYNFSPPDNKTASAAKEFFYFRWAFEKLIDFLKNKNYLAQEHPLRKLVIKNHFNFYHPGSEIYQDFETSENIPLNDKVLADTLKGGFKFPYKSNFFNGCVQIKRIKA